MWERETKERKIEGDRYRQKRETGGEIEKKGEREEEKKIKDVYERETKGMNERETKGMNEREMVIEKNIETEGLKR